MKRDFFFVLSRRSTFRVPFYLFRVECVFQANISMGRLRQFSKNCDNLIENSNLWRILWLKTEICYLIREFPKIKLIECISPRPSLCRLDDCILLKKKNNIIRTHCNRYFSMAFYFIWRQVTLENFGFQYFVRFVSNMRYMKRIRNQ